ncbi:response regulator transcription factor [Arcticibacterium luteifluviistationis]|uniref:DNA-binding response regulator n=1 Tax=Arcticibacterium luteifluviistationis TaxID=1784714 RepID=A0A2Z4GFH6_9BACT|nr:response regulator transcription factor [Arcticibacterium luteifluviistationis]AWV99805.1 DNA-binding response regulator [Arcticibacterium luteifluviistationis]
MENQLKILLAEDDPNLGMLLQEYLSSKGYTVELARDGNEGLDLFLNTGGFDLCLLDVMMPKKDGFSLAKEIRLKDEHVPIIFLTAKSMKEDTIQGFKSGADDYMTKPFSMEELLMRIAAILRRVNKQEPEDAPIEFTIGPYSFNTIDLKLTLNGGESKKLTTKESELLKLFCQNQNKPVSRSYALKLIWGDDSYFNARSMDVYITKLRKHLKADENIKILNLHGEGFKLITG